MTQASPEMTFESQDPAIQEQVDSAHVLAKQANDSFTGRYAAAECLAADLNTSDADITQTEETFKEHDRYYNLYLSAATALMPSRAAIKAAEAVQEAEESLASPEVWSAMSREQQAFALEARAALAAGKLKEHGVTEESLRVLMTEVDGKNKFTLVHTGAGVDIGNSRKGYDPARSYNGVMSDKNDKVFQVEVGGFTFDSRSGMKSAVYDAKVQDARDRDVILPDSQQLAQETDDVWTWTMLTGDGLTADGDVPIRNVGEGEVDRDVVYPDRGYRGVRVCPAVEIPDFSLKV